MTNSRSWIPAPRLLDADGQFIRLLTADEAASLVELGTAQAFGSKRRLHVARLVATGTASREGLALPRLPKLPPESHKRETGSNPPGVWTLRAICGMDRPVFIRPLLDCLRYPSQTAKNAGFQGNEAALVCQG